MYKNSYIADGQTTQFVFAFPFFQAADISVALNGVVLNSSEYDLNINSEYDGGTVSFVDAPYANNTIDIYRQIKLERTIDYQPLLKIKPESLNSDFNFLLEAFKDFKQIDIDLEEWNLTHTNTIEFLQYTNDLIKDKLGGGGNLGLFNNLLSVLDNALPQLINDYGYITQIAPGETKDDYGLL